MTRTRLINLQRSHDRTFVHVLVSTLLVAVMNISVWFAVTFWVFLETKSVLATGMVAGMFLGATAISGIWFGSVVDHHHKKRVMQASALASGVFYVAAFGLYQLTPVEVFQHASSVRLWVFIGLCMTGMILGNLRTIALQTLVTLLIEAERRDRANGLVGTVTGATFLGSSLISGLLVAADGMRYVLLLALAVLAVSLVHLAPVRLDDPVTTGPTEHDADASGSTGGTGALGRRGRQVDLRGTVRLVRAVPGLLALIGFSCLNNFIGGAFMALVDAYGLYMVSVQTWGLLWAALSAFLIVGGLLVARTGLGARPLRVLLLINAVLWVDVILFPLRSSIVMLAIGMAVYMALVPYAEAAEQTILQRVVPYERQGRVFGFAQSVEMAASPLTAFLIGPITQLVFIPFMTTGSGADLIGGWFGVGPDRGIALVFVLSGALGLLLTVIAIRSRAYRLLSAHHADAVALAPVG